MCFKGREREKKKKRRSPVSQGQLPGYRHLLLPGGSDAKASVYNAGDMCILWGFLDVMSG